MAGRYRRNGEVETLGCLVQMLLLIFAIQCRGTVVSVLTLESLAPERYNKNSYSLRLKPTGGCLFLCREILNRNLFIRYAINKLRPVQSRKRKQTCRMTSLLRKTT